LPPDRTEPSAPGLGLGSRDPAVAQVRRWLVELGLLHADADEAAAAYTRAVDKAIRAFQQERGLDITGRVDPETYRELEGARWRLGGRALHHHVSHPYTGDDVLTLQVRLAELGFDVGRPDGHFGSRTETALRDFQRNYGLSPDGTVGPNTIRALRQLSRSVRGGRSFELREAEALRHRGPRLSGKKVVIDPAAGGNITGVTGHGLTERDVVGDIGRRLEGRLAVAGVDAFLTHGPDHCPTIGERADFANATSADLLLSLHVDADVSPAPNGVATFYYGNRPGSGSVAGERLAGLVQRELVSRTDFNDCRIHGRTWELLRRTRMTAVHVDIGYLSNGGDAKRLAQADLRDTMAEALMAAIQRLFLPDDMDPTTGVLYLPAFEADS
jgi:N-acetylmuramoyl-L-alanine amidase